MIKAVLYVSLITRFILVRKQNIIHHSIHYELYCQEHIVRPALSKAWAMQHGRRGGERCSVWWPHIMLPQRLM